MPIEIREIVIKTEVISPSKPEKDGISTRDLKILKKEIVKECISLLNQNLTNTQGSR